MKYALKGIQYICLVCVMIFGAAVILGSGGGSDDDTDSSGSSDLTYTGETSQATVSQGNADDISSSVYGGYSELNENADILTDLESISGLPIKTETSLRRIAEASMAIGSKSSAALVTREADGSCGGTRTLSVTNFTHLESAGGTIEFDEFCNTSVTIAGTMTFSATFGDGSPSLNLSSDQLIIKNNTTEDINQINDFSLEAIHGTNSTEVAFSGTFYVPDYGYVTVQTTEGNPFVFESGNTYPSSGQMTATGTSSTSARLTAVNSTTYKIDVEWSGDEQYDDYTTGEINW